MYDLYLAIQPQPGTADIDFLSKLYVYDIFYYPGKEEVVDKFEEFLSMLYSNRTDINKSIFKKYANYRPIFTVADDHEEFTAREAYNEWEASAFAFLRNNSLKYLGLFESTILEFNPLWNVDGTEVRSFNDRESKIEYGRTDTRTDTEVRQDIDKNRGNTVSSYEISDNGTEYLNNRTITKEGSNTSDPMTERKVASGNVENVGSGADSTKELGEEILTRQGNIGVVSTVKLLQEYQELTQTNVLDVMFSDLFNATCIA